MPKILRSAIAAAILTAGFWGVSATPSYAAGDYYAAHEHYLKGCAPAAQ